jgi:hypothetical protein
VTDATLLEQLLELHFPEPPSILSAGHGAGHMFRGCRYQPTVTLDVRPLAGIDVHGSWDDLASLFSERRFQVVTWDPPHQTDGGTTALGGGWATDYGTAGAELRGQPNISFMYAPFLEAARAVLDPRGTLLAKIADQVHNGVLQLQAFDLVNELHSSDWHVCAVIPKRRAVVGDDPKWKRRFHVRQAWSYWICAHPHRRCPAVGVSLERPKCGGCGEPFTPRRTDQRSCGADKCRQRVHRKACA